MEVTVTGAFRSGRALIKSGVTLIATGYVLVLSCVFVSASMSPTWWWGYIEPFLYILPGPMIPLGLFLFWRGRQYAAEANDERILTDSNPDVLYLRDFRSDYTTAWYIFSSALSLGWGFATEEEQLADALRPFGDLIAIGQPGERLPQPGAARIYASEKEWRELVKRHMRAARLVVIRAGVGGNLFWELTQAVENLNPQKVLILVLKMKVKEYESLRTKVTQALSLSLPPATALRCRLGRVYGFIDFGLDWKPSVFPLRAPFSKLSMFKPCRSLFKFALRPVFERYGLEWQPPPNLLWLNVIILVITWVYSILLYYFVFWRV